MIKWEVIDSEGRGGLVARADTPELAIEWALKRYFEPTDFGADTWKQVVAEVLSCSDGIEAAVDGWRLMRVEVANE